MVSDRTTLGLDCLRVAPALGEALPGYNPGLPGRYGIVFAWPLLEVCVCVVFTELRITWGGKVEEEREKDFIMATILAHEVASVWEERCAGWLVYVVVVWLVYRTR